MPSTSPKQHRFMEAIAHSPGFARKAGVPQKVGKDFAVADDKAGITKRHSGSSPQSPGEQMAKRHGQGVSYREVAGEHGVSKSTAHRKARSMMRDGFTKEGDGW